MGDFLLAPACHREDNYMEILVKPLPMRGNLSLVGGKLSPIINMKTASDSMTDSCTSILASL